MDRPLPWLRYVDAGDLDDGTVGFDGMDVEDAAGQKVGNVDEFIRSSHARPIRARMLNLSAA